MSQDIKAPGISEGGFTGSTSQSEFFANKFLTVAEELSTPDPRTDISNPKGADEFILENQTVEHSENKHLAQCPTLRQGDFQNHFGHCSLVTQKLKNEESSSGLEQLLTTFGAENCCSCHDDSCYQIRKTADSKALLKSLQDRKEKSSKEGLKSNTSSVSAKIQPETHIMSPPINFTRLIDSEALGFSKNDSLWTTALPAHGKIDISQNITERIRETGLGSSTLKVNHQWRRRSVPYEGRPDRKVNVLQCNYPRSTQSNLSKIVYSCAHCNFKSYGSKKFLKQHLISCTENSACTPGTDGKPLEIPCGSHTSQHFNSTSACGSENSHLSLKKDEKFVLESAGCSKSLYEDGQYKSSNFSSGKSCENPLPSSSSSKTSDLSSSYMEKYVSLPAFKQLLRCKYCYVKFEQYSDFKTHMKMHPSEGLLSCALCPYKSTYQNNIEEHVMSHHGCVNILLCM
nr:PREDICTED: uncharacterized protein LOC109042745 [Bemisia tabaci]